MTNEEIARLIDEGIDLCSRIDLMEIRLNEVKRLLREKGKELAAVRGAPNVKLQGNDGSALIVFPKPSQKIVNDANVRALSKRIGPENFKNLIRTTISYAPTANFAKMLESCTHVQRSIVREYVEERELTPRVEFVR